MRAVQWSRLQRRCGLVGFGGLRLATWVLRRGQSVHSVLGIQCQSSPSVSVSNCEAIQGSVAPQSRLVARTCVSVGTVHAPIAWRAVGGAGGRSGGRAGGRTRAEGREGEEDRRESAPPGMGAQAANYVARLVRAFLLSWDFRPLAPADSGSLAFELYFPRRTGIG